MNNSKIPVEWTDLPEETHPIIQQLQNWLEALPLGIAEDPGSLILRLEEWQEQLEELDKNVHIIWCFTPELVIRVGPTFPHSPITPWLQDRLQSIAVYRMTSESLCYGSLSADTMLSARQDGWRMYIRDQVYLEQFEKTQERELECGILRLFDPEDAILWRQELNLAHEWGHLYTEAHIPYQEPLLERLSPHPPEQGMPLFQWFEALLEGLAESISEHGALAFLCELGQEDSMREIASSLLWERIQELSNAKHTEALRSVYGLLLLALSPQEKVFSPKQLQEDVQNKTGDPQWEESLYPEQLNWSEMSHRLGKAGDLLQQILLESIEELPLSAPVEQFLPQMQKKIETYASKYLLDLEQK